MKLQIAPSITKAVAISFYNVFKTTLIIIEVAALNFVLGAGEEQRMNNFIGQGLPFGTKPFVLDLHL